MKFMVKSAPGGEGFATVPDYESALHLWFMSMREDIVKAKGVLDGPGCTTSDGTPC